MVINRIVSCLFRLALTATVMLLSNSDEFARVELHAQVDGAGKWAVSCSDGYILPVTVSRGEGGWCASYRGLASGYGSTPRGAIAHLAASATYGGGKGLPIREILAPGMASADERVLHATNETATLRKRIEAMMARYVSLDMPFSSVQREQILADLSEIVVQEKS